MACVICGGPTKRNSNPNPRCADCYRSLMADRNRRDAPERMRTRNPMANDKTREQMMMTLKRIGHKPPFRGGNGAPSAPAVALLASALNWPKEVAIGTGKGSRAKGLSTHYKIDIGHPLLKIGIEVDGGSHGMRSRQDEDRKKELFLKSVGWTVLRFSNEDVISDTTKCVLTVMSTISRQRTLIPISQMDS